MVKPFVPCLPEPSVANQPDVTLIGLIWMSLLPRRLKDHLCSLSVHKFFQDHFHVSYLTLGGSYKLVSGFYKLIPGKLHLYYLLNNVLTPVFFLSHWKF